MVVLTKACVANSSIRTAANWFAVQVEAGGVRPREGRNQHKTSITAGSRGSCIVICRGFSANGRWQGNRVWFGFVSMRMKIARWFCFVYLLVGLRISFAATTFKVGESGRVFKPSHARNWRGAKTEALVTTIWYPVSVDAKGVVEKPQSMGAPMPIFEAGSAAVDAPLATLPSKLPLVMLSHGTGGSAMQMAWMGTVLAQHGYIAVAVNHPGNNGLEPYTAEGFALWWERATDISDAIDALLKDSTFGPRVDAARIGAAGFSIGGYTVLELAGARSTQADFLAACEAEPTLPTCRVPEMKDFGSPKDTAALVVASSSESLARDSASYRDPRIRAVFAVAPRWGRRFGRMRFER
jgi:predicted dienelactone hydrolase